MGYQDDKAKDIDSRHKRSSLKYISRAEIGHELKK